LTVVEAGAGPFPPQAAVSRVIPIRTTIEAVFKGFIIPSFHFHRANFMYYKPEAPAAGRLLRGTHRQVIPRERLAEVLQPGY
jgi:hypothetical protein